MEKEGKQPIQSWLGLVYIELFTVRGNWSSTLLVMFWGAVWNMPLKYVEAWQRECVSTSSCLIGLGLPQEVLTLPVCADTPEWLIRLLHEILVTKLEKPWEKKIVATQYSWDQVLLAYTWVQLVAIAKAREKWWSKRTWERKLHVCLAHEPVPPPCRPGVSIETF